MRRRALLFAAASSVLVAAEVGCMPSQAPARSPSEPGGAQAAAPPLSGGGTAPATSVGAGQSEQGAPPPNGDQPPNTAGSAAAGDQQGGVPSAGPGGGPGPGDAQGQGGGGPPGQPGQPGQPGGDQGAPAPSQGDVSAPNGAADASPAAAGAGNSGSGGAPGSSAPGAGGVAPDLTRVRVAGYVIPTFAATSRTAAVPRDRLLVGLVSSHGGLIIRGEPYRQWSYTLHVGFDATVLNNRNAAATKVSTGPDPASFQFVTSVPVEEATVTFTPLQEKSYNDQIIAGHQYIPFSVGAGATITAQMFPTRPGPTSIFMAGADDGLVNSTTLLNERVFFKVGIFNGSSLGLQLPNTTTAGPVWSFFLDVHPLGKMPPREGDQSRGPPRVGLGVGTLYRVGTLYDEKGYQATHFKDIRLSTAARFAGYGLFLQVELLRRLQTDDLSSRPATATGFYGQGSFYYPVSHTVALGPLARGGVAAQDQDFAPQKTISFEGGLAFYPRADLTEPDALRFILEFVRETRQPFDETSNGGVANLQLRF